MTIRTLVRRRVSADFRFMSNSPRLLQIVSSLVLASLGLCRLRRQTASRRPRTAGGGKKGRRRHGGLHRRQGAVPAARRRPVTRCAWAPIRPACRAPGRRRSATAISSPARRRDAERVRLREGRTRSGVHVRRADRPGRARSERLPLRAARRWASASARRSTSSTATTRCTTCTRCR